SRVRAAEAVPGEPLERLGSERGRGGPRRDGRGCHAGGVHVKAMAGPLRARILIPVANPMTAEELIRLGAAMLDRRAGEISALRLHEVPEGMPLSQGGTPRGAPRER